MVRSIFLATICLYLVPPALANDLAAAAPAATLRWQSDYTTAYQQAFRQQKMLLVYFEPDKRTAASHAFEQKTLKDRQIQGRLSEFVLARLPVSATHEIEGQPQRLLAHRAFRYMERRAGLAIVDLKHLDEKFYGHTVSCLPFTSRARASFHSVGSVRTLLDLPAGTITQRTMVYAVRMHPERPRSTHGKFHPVLRDATERHSAHQARIRNLGHHNWGSRFQRITGQLNGRMAQEVCAQSWAGQTLVEAAIDCIHSWRQSGGHWSAVRGRHAMYAYDIKQGSDGIWYATGIFAG